MPAIVLIYFLGVACHGESEEQTYRQLAELVREEIAELTRAGKPLPEPVTRPMREAVIA
jgi:hypothetical protein